MALSISGNDEICTVRNNTYKIHKNFHCVFAVNNSRYECPIKCPVESKLMVLNVKYKL